MNFSSLATKLWLSTTLFAVGASTSIASSKLRNPASEAGKESIENKISKEETQQFKKSLELYRDGQFEDALKIFLGKENKSQLLSDYDHYFAAQSYFSLGKFDLADAQIKEVLKLSPNTQMSIEATALQGQLAINNKEFKKAFDIFTKLEKRTKYTEIYPEVLFNLALSAKGSKKNPVMCKSLLKLYRNFPGYNLVQFWGPDLAINEFAGSPTYCASNAEDFKTRVRFLLWSGLDQKAQEEILQLRQKLAKSDPYTADKLQAQFYLQEGEPQKALDLIKSYATSKSQQFDYLMLYGSASARAGELQSASESYLQAYRLSPQSKSGRKALFQSAFLSYQVQDFAGAESKFNDVIKKFGNSGLSQDAKWHLAWIKYLKKDYDQAYKDFSKIRFTKKKGRKILVTGQERSEYWMAMSLMRQKKFGQARTTFEKLARDPLLGYYSLAAQARLKKMEEQKQTQDAPSLISLAKPSRLNQISNVEMLLASADEPLNPDIFNDDPDESAETEEESTLSQYSTEEKSDSDSDSEAEDSAAVADATEKMSLNSSHLVSRLARAKILLQVNEKDWARWDLYDIEKRTRDREQLKTLMELYALADQYHRSAYIAQVTFGGARSHLGFDGAGKSLWEAAYPKAYFEFVSKNAKDFKVPVELIYGIMRSESTYRRDAISPVGALGLMQVMPVTGYKVAQILNDKKFKAVDLLTPEPAIRIGSRYLKRLSDRFNQVIPLIAAGYNAGPHRVKSWLISYGTLETDEFIEHIPFMETRNYVKRVMSNAQIYQSLYGNKATMFPYLAEPMPFKLSSDHADKENWDDI